MPASSDPLLDALLHPFREGRLAPVADTLFLNARAAPGLPDVARSWTCVQSFKPAAVQLQALGMASQPAPPDPPANFAQVLLPLPGQRDLARACLVNALRLLAPGGVLVTSQANASGARSAMADLGQLVGPVEQASKHHCRVAWTLPGWQRLDPDREAQWLAQAAPREVPGTPWLAQPGVFARDRIDPGSALLAAHLPTDLRGAAADLGAGWGFLSATLLARCPGIESIDLFEADAVALALARRNLQDVAGDTSLDFHWHDVAAGVPGRFEVIVSNPPFHAAGNEDRQLGRDFIAAAAGALKPGGRFWLVANRHLPYEAELSAGFSQVREVAVEAGYKIIEARTAS